MKAKINKEIDITEKKARKLIKKMCRDFDVSPCNCWFINIGRADTIGWYSPAFSNMASYMMIEKYWSRRLILVLHEFAHHLQTELYESKFESMHGESFQLAKKRVATWAKNNISKSYNWYYMIQRYTQGRNLKPKK